MKRKSPTLICKLFGHKFFYTHFEKTGQRFLEFVGVWVDDGITYRRETTYCTRCGLERSTINQGKENDKE